MTSRLFQFYNNNNNNNYKHIDVIGTPITGVGQSHSQGTMENSSANFSAVYFSIKLTLDLGGDFVLMIYLNCLNSF